MLLIEDLHRDTAPLWEVILSLGRSKKQNVVARSRAEAKFRSVAHEICEIMWIKRILEDLRVSAPLLAKVYCDNKTVISITHNLVLHDSSVSLGRRFDF